MSKDLLIVSKKWASNRSAHTSVERFCALLDPSFTNYHGERQPLPPGISRYFKQRTNARPETLYGYSAPYNSLSFELEIWALRKALVQPPKYIFFPYADYDYYYWRYFKRFFNAKIILWSFFSVRELQCRFKNLDHFASADLILAAGQGQVQHLKEKLPHSRVGYFPIGVDTDFFVPGTAEKQPFRMVHVGNNRRDFVTLIAGLDKLYEHMPQLMVDLIGVSTVKEKIPRRDYLHIHPFIDEERYREILQSATCAVLCLEDGGSSNSILEMMACGLPIVITDLENIRDYIDDSACQRIPPGNPQALCETCSEILNDITIQEKRGKAAREHALKYDWHKLKQCFETIVKES